MEQIFPSFQFMANKNAEIKMCWFGSNWNGPSYFYYYYYCCNCWWTKKKNLGGTAYPNTRCPQPAQPRTVLPLVLYRGKLSPSRIHLPKWNGKERTLFQQYPTTLYFLTFPSATLKSNLQSSDKQHLSVCDGHFIQQTLGNMVSHSRGRNDCVPAKANLLLMCKHEKLLRKKCFKSFLPSGSNSNYHQLHSHISFPSPPKPIHKISCPGLDLVERKVMRFVFPGELNRNCSTE